jgi:hypothetical protein
MPEESRRRVDLGDIDEDPRAKGQTIQPEAIAAHRGFRFSPTGQIIPYILAEVPARREDDLLVGNKVDWHVDLLGAVVSSRLSMSSLDSRTRSYGRIGLRLIKR